MDAKGRKGIPTFSVILIMAVLMVVGIGMIPLLNIQYTPVDKTSSFTVGYGWHGASAHVIEQEVTSKIEGIMAGISGVKNVSSTSSNDSGSVTGTFKKKSDLNLIRLELSSRLRSLYSSLPRGVSYPTIYNGTDARDGNPIITYTLNSPLPPNEILKYAENNINKPLSRVDGVGRVQLSGATPFFVEIVYDAAVLSSSGLDVNRLAEVLGNALSAENVLGMTEVAEGDGEKHTFTVKLDSGYGYDSLLAIPVSNVNGRVVYLRDVAEVHYKEKLPDSYYRVNGLNTINIGIYAEEHVNTLNVINDVKAEMTRLEGHFPDSFSIEIIDDSSVYIKEELNKIYLRTLLSILILLAFVFILNRNWRYLFVITLTLVANILVAFIFYNLFDVDINIYSLAGITVSLGMVIDSSIIMVDHYSYYRDRRVFLAILGALLTTIASLIIVFFLPEAQRRVFYDFSMVLIINLTVSLVISFLFIPSIIERFPVYRGGRRVASQKRARRVIRFNRVYKRVILFFKKRKWILVVLIVLGFGLPVNLLPEKIEKEGFWPELYNKTLGGSWYQDKGKRFLEPVLGGSVRLFTEDIKRNPFSFRDPERATLSIYASMPEGSSVQQLNDVLQVMERYLDRFPNEISIYKTNIYSAEEGYITVSFTEEAEKSNFPELLKSGAIEVAQNSGGASWRISGRDPNSFSTGYFVGYLGNQIVVKGYNYDKLYDIATASVENLLENPRINVAQVTGYSWETLRNEFYVDYDLDKVAMSDIDLIAYNNLLQQRLYSSYVAQMTVNNAGADVELVSSASDEFDIWHVNNDMVTMGERSMRLSDFGSIEKKRIGNVINKEDQQYILYVSFDFVGNSTLAQRVRDAEIERLNSVMPVGFKAEKAGGWSWEAKDARQYLLLFLIIVIIYFICSILFESLVQPLLIILLIPVSFIGLFLTYHITETVFDQGSFAAMVLLCGLVVNAAIYLINEYNIIKARTSIRGLNAYIKAYNRKIIPISLTIISTVLGLIPFLIDGKGDVFWYSFAVGTMGGMLFSIIALILVLPVFLPLKKCL